MPVADDVQTRLGTMILDVLGIVRDAVAADLRINAPGFRRVTVRRRVRATVVAALRDVNELVAVAARTAAADADAEARRDLTAAGFPIGDGPGWQPNLTEPQDMINGAAEPLVDAADNAYMAAVADRDRTEQVLRDFADDGVRGRDRLGRRWELPAYAATVATTTVAHAARIAYVARMQAAAAAQEVAG